MTTKAWYKKLTSMTKKIDKLAARHPTWTIERNFIGNIAMEDEKGNIRYAFDFRNGEIIKIR